MNELLTLKRVADLDRRVRRIEQHLQLPNDSWQWRDDAAPATAAASPVSDTVPASEVWPDEPPLAARVEAEPAPARPPVQPPPLPVMPLPEEPAVAEAFHTEEVIDYQPPAMAPAVEKKPTSSVEQWIGLNWTGWVGAIVLVIGAALGIKYAYDQGWLGGLPKEVRLAFCFALGLGLLAVGEWIDRKVDRIAAAGVFAAGVATLFVVSYAGFGYFDLYAQTTAFVLMGISTLIGAAVAMRKNLVVIASLSLLGGNIAPIVLQTNTPRIGALLGYILVLQLVALFLTGWGKGGKWWILRGFAIAMPTLWTAVAYDHSPFDLWLPLRFSVAYAVLLQVELVYASRNQETLRRGLVAPASILVTSLLLLSVLYGLQDYTRTEQGVCVLVMAAAAGAMGWVLYGRRAELSIGYRMQSALLVLVAVPVALTGLPVMLAWGGLSLAYALAGRAMGSPWGKRFGIAAWLAAVGYLMHWYATQDAALAVFALDLPAYFFLAAGLALIGHALAFIVPADEAPINRSVVVQIEVLASVMFILAALNAMETWHATAAILAYAWLMHVAGHLLARPAWTVHSAALLGVALIKWASVDMLGGRVMPATKTPAYLPVANPLMAVGTVLAGSVVAMYWLSRETLEAFAAKHRGASSLAIGVATVVLAIMTFALSMEVDRSAAHARAAALTDWPPVQLRMLGWTILWTAAAAVHAGLVVKLVGDLPVRQRWLRVSSALIGLVAIKFVVLDTLLFWLGGDGSLVTPLVNLQTFAALVLAAGLGLVGWLRGREQLSWRFGGAMLLSILLLCGTVEIDRFFEHARRTGTMLTDARFAKQVAISIYWSVFAVIAIIAGFRLRMAGLRYFGLGLLAVALGKVVVIDLQEIGRGYRILSFLGLGGLLLATSVLYGKLSPILLRSTEAPTGGSTPLS